MLMRLIFLTLCALVLIPLTAAGQSLQPIEDADRIAELEAQLEATEGILFSVNDELMTLRAQSEAGLLEAHQARNEAVIDHLSYEQSLRGHALSILDWQLVSSYVVLGLVVAVTLLGVILSFMEVKNAMKAPDKVMEALKTGDFGTADDDGGAGGTPPPANGTTLVISAQKLQVTSAITGVVILVLSLAFLYLFVKEVLATRPMDFSTELAPTIQGEGDENPAAEDPAG